MKLPKIENLKFILVMVLVILGFFFFILGLSGMLAALGIILLFLVPAYFILDNFDLKQDEKVVFSFFIGVGIFPILAYWLGFFISFRLAMFLTFIVLIVIGMLVGKYKKNIIKLFS
jgi:apolipoprotein N-acyltransferase|tara:strand:- start:41 stop:388 length:348 start_codon:yes stop_codon:yes gene_type:complete